MLKNSKIYIAGHQGLVGSALMRTLQTRGHTNLITRTLAELDLRNQQAVNAFFEEQKPEYVFLAAARVGGIHANATRPAEFIYDNLAIELNVIHAAYEQKVKKLLFLGSSCIYPRDAQQPLCESALLTGPLEPTNAPYALAKIAGIGMCQAYNKQYGTNFISAMPTNLYGPGDTFDALQAHVIPALITKFCDAIKNNGREVTVWGSGEPYREFLYVNDCADALIFLMENFNASYATPSIGIPSEFRQELVSRDWINIGTGHDIQIKDLIYLIAQITGFDGEIVFDRSYPDGTPRKRLEVSRLNALGWRAQTNLQDGLIKTIEWYKSRIGKLYE